MTVTVNIKPELEAQLVVRARSHGQSLEGYIERLLEIEATGPETAPRRELSGAEKAQAFEAWARSFPSDPPSLSLESISRENIYHRD